MKYALWVFLAANVVAFCAYGVDKWKAARGRWRVPELWLLGFAVPLASPGAWAGIKTFRHKTRKPSFLWKLVVLTLLQVGAVSWFLGRYGWPEL